MEASKYIMEHKFRIGLQKKIMQKIYSHTTPHKIMEQKRQPRISVLFKRLTQEACMSPKYLHHKSARDVTRKEKTTREWRYMKRPDIKEHGYYNPSQPSCMLVGPRSNKIRFP